MVKHMIIGTALILYALLLTPAFIEPTDIVVSTAWLAAAMAAGIPMFIIGIWMASGYIAFVAGAILIGHFIFHRIPAVVAILKNPLPLILLVAFLILIGCIVLGVI